MPSYSQQLPNPEITKKLISGIVKPHQLDRALIDEARYMDWVTAISIIKHSLKDAIGNGIDPNLKVEVQMKLKREHEEVARKEYSSVMTDLKSTIGEKRASLLKDIKSKKFPNYSKTVSDAFLKESPNYQARQLGIAELAIANSMPLKHINAEVLKNHFSAGRYDLVSGMIERVALNRSETNTAVWDGIQNFAKTYYEKIGVAGDREALRKLSALEDMVINPLSVGLDVDGGAVAFGQPKYDQVVGQDNLLEFQ